MGSFAMEGVKLFSTPEHSGVAPVSNHVDGLSHAHSEGHKHGSDSHGKDDQGHGTELELNRWTRPNHESSRVELSEVAIDKDAGADQENSHEESQHDVRPALSRGLSALVEPVSLWASTAGPIRPAHERAWHLPKAAPARNAGEHRP